MKTILVPTDFSDNAANALFYAAALASHTKSRLVLVHAIAMDVIELPGNPFDLKPDRRLESYYLAELEHLAGRVRVKNGLHLEVETICVHGKILDHLNKLVISQEADLVVMGTKGANNLLRKLMGTTTASYIGQAVCPVLAVPISAWYQGLKKIAYASDFENNDTNFLRQLFRFTDSLEAEVCIFNIKSEEQLDLVADSQVLRQIQKNFPDNRYSIAQMKKDDVIAGIQSFLQENQVNMLALPVHKPDLIERIFHTRVSETLAFQTAIPLLALPEKPCRHAQATKVRKRRFIHKG
jgi:nucleotide-binding universal stress UspA family protein